MSIIIGLTIAIISVIAGFILGIIFALFAIKTLLEKWPQ